MEKSVYTPEYQTFLRLLRAARLEMGLTQGQVATALHEAQSSVSKWERGEHRIDIVELYRICTAMGVDFAAFATRFQNEIAAR